MITLNRSLLLYSLPTAAIDFSPIASGPIVTRPNFRPDSQSPLTSSRQLNARDLDVVTVPLSATPPFARNMDALVSVRRVGEDFSLPHRRRERDGRSSSMKIEHDLRRARLTRVHCNSPNLIETHTGRHDPSLRGRLLYLGATGHSGQNGSADEAIE
jgi:hypothetical protein